MSIAKGIQSSMQRSSWIREMFEQGQRLKEKFGEDQVFDFALGNPTMDPPKAVNDALIRLLQENQAGAHRYMPNPGLPGTRSYLAEELQAEQNLHFESSDVVMCVGAGGGLNAFFKAVLDPQDEVVALAPYFVEYGFYAQNHGGVLKVAETDENFQIDLDKIEAALSPKTKVLVINSPNNPTGVVYSQDSVNALGALLAKKEAEYGHAIFLVSDEPYRHIIFDGLSNCSVFAAHSNSVMITSHSKDLALPGERIGYIAIHPGMEDRVDLQNALSLTTRILGFVNAPALMQRILPQLKGVSVSIETYQNLRDILYDALTDMGFEIVKPQGAFYLFPKSPIPDDVAFVKQAVSENILLVPGTGFGCPGHVRISYCFPEEMITRSLPRFQKIADHYGLK